MLKTQKYWSSFMELILEAKERKTLSDLLDLFLTSEEKSNLGMRYSIVMNLLENKKTQRELAKELNVSIAKITRGSNELKRTDKKLIEYLKKKS